MTTAGRRGDVSSVRPQQAAGATDQAAAWPARTEGSAAAPALQIGPREARALSMNYLGGLRERCAVAYFEFSKVEYVLRCWMLDAGCCGDAAMVAVV